MNKEYTQEELENLKKSLEDFADQDAEKEFDKQALREGKRIRKLLFANERLDRKLDD